MSYILGQYNKRKNSGDENNFMTIIESGSAERQELGPDYEVTGNENYSTQYFEFFDEVVRVDLIQGQTYYFHGKIKRMNSIQIFDIKLWNNTLATNPNDDEVQEQYIKTIRIDKGNVIKDSKDDRYDVIEADWVDVEFIFTPQYRFNYIAFELRRDVALDYKWQIRYPLIAYEEISEVQNFKNKIISSGDNENINFIKIGVQSRPGLLMCINREEIRTSRTGIYELKDGTTTINFFSVCDAIKEADYSITHTIDDYTDITDEDKTIINQMNMAEWMMYVNNYISYWDNQNKIWHDNGAREDSPGESDFNTQQAKEKLLSKCFFGSQKASTREIDSFTLDYLYKD